MKPKTAQKILRFIILLRKVKRWIRNGFVFVFTSEIFSQLGWTRHSEEWAIGWFISSVLGILLAFGGYLESDFDPSRLLNNRLPIALFEFGLVPIAVMAIVRIGAFLILILLYLGGKISNFLDKTKDKIFQAEKKLEKIAISKESDSGSLSVPEEFQGRLSIKDGEQLK